MSKETWNVLHSKPKKSLFFNTPGTYSILHANLYENYIVLCIKKQKKVYQDFLFIKSSRNNFIFSPVFYLVCF